MPFISDNLNHHDLYQRVIVIPALAEYANLSTTLKSLEQNPKNVLKQTLIIVNVNNRQEALEDFNNNQKTLHWLKMYTGILNLLVLDYSSPGKEVPLKKGVGFARKIACDIALTYLSSDGLLYNLDADTIVEPNYVSNVQEFFNTTTDCQAAYVSFKHQKTLDKKQNKAIEQYEQFLDYYFQGLTFAKSPYAYHTIGSTIICSVKAYKKVQGFDEKRQAGEDFYFMQKITKAGFNIHKIDSTKIYPSSRESHRVPFGTGKSITDLLMEKTVDLKTYHPECFNIVKNILSLAKEQIDENSSLNLNQLDKETQDFFMQRKFHEVWKKLQANSKNAEMLLKKFHEWFDAFQTLKLIHYLSEKKYPKIPISEAITLLREYHHE